MALQAASTGMPLADLADTKPKGAMATISARKRKPRVEREVVADLARRILSGEIPSNEILAREPTLYAQYGVSRAAMRAPFGLSTHRGAPHEQALPCMMWWPRPFACASPTPRAERSPPSSIKPPCISGLATPS